MNTVGCILPPDKNRHRMAPGVRHIITVNRLICSFLFVYFCFQDKEYYWRFENSSYPDARRKDKFYKSYVQKNGKKVLSDFSRIIVYMKDDAIQKIIESPLMILPQLLSEIGGQLGIWVGVSIITLSEVIELVVNLLSQLLRRKISKTSKNETHDVRNNTCELLDVVVVDAEDKPDGNISA